MTKLRSPITWADAMTRVAGTLTFAGARKIVTRSDSLVRKWSDASTGKLPTIEQALRLDTAHRAHGGEGAPFFDTYAALLEIRVSQVMACRIALAEDLASVAREYGDALSAAIAVTLPGATARDVLRALAETEEAYSRTGRLMRRLKSFLPFGVAPRAGITGGLE